MSKTYIPDRLEIKMINKFEQWIKNKNQNEDFVVDFFEYQASYWLWRLENDLMNQPNSYIKLSWFFGDKARTRWEERAFVDDRYLRLVRKKIGVLRVSKLSDSNRFCEIHDFEELEKKRYHNTEAGLQNCIELTMLYNHKSKLCLRCNFSAECKNLLNVNFPKIYKLRGYDKAK